MDHRFSEHFETRLRETGRQFPYPPTPDIAGAITRRLGTAQSSQTRRRRQAAWAAALLILALAGLMAVPSVRAAVIDFIQVGAIRIFLAAPATKTPSPPENGTATAPAFNPPAATPSLSTFEAQATPLASLLDLSGETTLAEARAKAGFTLKLPTYPPGLGLPQHVYLQDLNGPVILMAWVNLKHPGKVRLVLQEFGPGTFAEKVAPEEIQATTVNGNDAVWTTGPYLLVSKDGQYLFQRLIEGHVLIWTEGDITYRLETDQTMDEARKIAESLR